MVIDRKHVQVWNCGECAGGSFASEAGAAPMGKKKVQIPLLMGEYRGYTLGGILGFFQLEGPDWVQGDSNASQKGIFTNQPI